MPLYDFQCLKCNKEFEQFSKIDRRLSVKCSCGGKTKVLLSTASKDWFKPSVWEDFTDYPIEVTSKKHLKELCKKHGVYARALD